MKQSKQGIKKKEMMINLRNRNFTFEHVHVDGARALAEAAAENGVARFVQVSALNASADSPSKFLRSKVILHKYVMSLLTALCRL